MSDVHDGGEGEQADGDRAHPPQPPAALLVGGGVGGDHRVSVCGHRGRLFRTPGRVPECPPCRPDTGTVITFGTFDVFHVGHLRVIERAAALGDRLVVGVSADELNLRKKGREPVFSQAERLEIVAALKVVDEVFVEESLELKRDYIERVRRRRAGHGRRLEGPLRRVRGRLRGRLPPPHAGDLHHRPDREDLQRG